MAKAGDEIANPRTGQRMVFLETGEETGGELLRIDSYNPPSPPLESEHVHPFQESGAEVISGSLCFRVGGEEQSVKAGESITIPVDTPHHFWNDGEEEVAHSVQWFKQHIDLTAEPVRAVTGVQGLLTVPGLGAVLFDVGRIVTNLETDEVTFQAGPHQLVEGDLAGLCEPLAP